MSFSSLLSQEKVKKKKLEKVQKYLHCVIARKNEIFKKFMENGLLSYDLCKYEIHKLEKNSKENTLNIRRKCINCFMRNI